MNNIAELRHNSTNFAAFDQEEFAYAAEKGARITSGALMSQGPLHIRGQDQGNKLGFQSPPPPRESTTMRLAEDALNRILGGVGGQTSGKTVTLVQFEQTPMEAMVLASALLGVKALGDNANLKSLALDIRTHGAENLRLRQNEDLRKQVDKAIEDQGKAQKAAIFSVVTDWIVSIAEVVSGVVKIVVGDYAGGAMDFGAGSAGLVKAFAETMALTTDGETADKWKEIAHVAGMVQLGFEIAGMVVDVTNVFRGRSATKAIAKTTEAVMENGGSEALKVAINTGSKEAIKNCAGNLGNQVAEQVAEQVAKNVSAPLCEKLLASNVSKEMARALVKNGSKEVVKDALKQALTKTITEAMEKAAEQAMKQGGEITAAKLTESVVQKVQSEVSHAVLKASLTSTANIGKNVTRATLIGANGVSQGTINGERAKLQQDINKLMSDSSFMQYLLDDFEKVKKRTNEDIRNLMEGAGKSLSAASDSQNKTSAMLSNIAAHIV